MKTFKNSLLLAFVYVAVSFSDYVPAKDYVYFGGWSHHFNDHPKSWEKEIKPESTHKCWKLNQCVTGTQTIEYEFNDEHRMIGIQTHGMVVANFENSFGQNTWLVAKHFEKQHSDFPLAFIAQIGATNGYTDCNFEDSGTSAKTCGYYQFGVAVTKYKLQPVFSTSGSVFMLSLRIEL